MDLIFATRDAIECGIAEEWRLVAGRDFLLSLFFLRSLVYKYKRHWALSDIPRAAADAHAF